MKKNIISLEEIKKNTRWAIELDDGYGRHWVTGTWPEVEWAFQSEDFSDCDICANQPEGIKEFYDAYFEYCMANKCYGLSHEEFYDIWSA